MAGASLRRNIAGLALGGAVIAGLSACSTNNGPPEDANLVAGKQMFVTKCGSCHILARAGTKGTQGPNLDEAFQQALSEGFGRASVRGAVHSQILHPARLPATHPNYMPAELVTGKDAEDVSAYVAEVAARTGKDTGLLASAVKAPGAGKPVAAKDGVLQIPADPDGQLAYVTKIATATPGPLEVESRNDASIPHDIALEGNGVNEKGATVDKGGVSKFSTTVKAGEYAYYCTVQGHREGGMEGKLTVK